MSEILPVKGRVHLDLSAHIREKLIEHRGYEYVQLDRVRDKDNVALESMIYGEMWLKKNDGLIDDDGFQLI